MALQRLTTMSSNLAASTKNKKVFVAGHNGMVGSSILRQLRSDGYSNIVTCSRSQLDLRDREAVLGFMDEARPSQVYMAAAKVGGIHANNTYPAEFLHDNLRIELNLIESAWQVGVERVLFLGSSCIYPRNADQPMSEEALLTGVLEQTNEPYAIAKIAGIKLCESFNRQYQTDYRSLMPSNLYGPGDNYHPENSHVIPALIRRFHEAKESGQKIVDVWGTGKPRREFLFVDDLAKACVHVMELESEQYRAATKPMLSHINVGTGVDLTIAELAETVKHTVGYEGRVRFDDSKPDGTMRKMLDVTVANQIGWKATTPLAEGLVLAYEDFLRRQQ